jgi:hypothetical protein
VNKSIQKTLAANQLTEFYHNDFVVDQFRDFKACFTEANKPVTGVIIDIGGGVGYFAGAVKDNLGYNIRVIDMDPLSIEICNKKGIDAAIGDCTTLRPKDDETIVCFNLILHHLVADSEQATKTLQTKALLNWFGNSRRIFVNEYIYESYIQNFSGWLIYKITSSGVLSVIGKFISRLIPSFRANTFGIGVRFRSHSEWQQIFTDEGFHVTKSIVGIDEKVDFPLRMLLIKSIRRDSFLLESTV